LRDIAGISKFKSLLSKKFKTPPFQLASRAILLFLDRILLQKKDSDLNDDLNINNKNNNNSSKILGTQDELLALSSNPNYQMYTTFFQEATSFLSPLCTLKDFKIACCKTLVPIYTYLEHV